MALSGNTRDLSLADLILVIAQDSRNHRLTLTGPAGDGLLSIRAGRIVHAAYGELSPMDAACLLVTEQDVDFEVAADAEIPGQTIDLGAQELLMQAMHRLDEGTLKRPRPVRISVASGRGLREPPRPRAYQARKSPEAEALRRAMGRVLFAAPEAEESGRERRSAPKVLAGVLAASLLVAGSALAWRFGWLDPKEHRDPVEISDLDGPRDVPPVLLTGSPPTAPEPDARFLPTILCRILVDTRGRVHAAMVYEKRAGLEAFEEAAIAAVREYRFAPARRQGVVVPAWVNWPVDFVRPAPPSSSPKPVEARHFKPPRDKLPVLLEGEPPETPIPERRLRPRIRCRLLVDQEGKVIDAEVLHSRPDLELYESVALDAVRSYRFTPAEREGVRVPAWIHWSVEFR